jgi:hypothetical protein
MLHKLLWLFIKPESAWKRNRKLIAKVNALVTMEQKRK